LYAKHRPVFNFFEQRTQQLFSMQEDGVAGILALSALSVPLAGLQAQPASALTRAELKTEFTQSRLGTIVGKNKRFAEIRTDIKDMATKQDKRLEQIEADIKAVTKDLRGEIKDLRGELTGEITELRAEFRWGAAGLGGLGLGSVFHIDGRVRKLELGQYRQEMRVQIEEMKEKMRSEDTGCRL
jgi:hypothetical protein